MALSREKILDTAFTLLRQYGLADLSMRRLATELSVAPGALYYHVKNKQELLSSLASRMVDHLCFEGETPQKALFSGSLELYTRMIPVRDGAEIVRLAIAIHPHTMVFIVTAGKLFARMGVKNSELAAKSLLYLCLSLIEEEQTRALLEGFHPAETAKNSYLCAVGATISGWTGNNYPLP